MVVEKEIEVKNVTVALNNEILRIKATNLNFKSTFEIKFTHTLKEFEDYNITFIDEEVLDIYVISAYDQSSLNMSWRPLELTSNSLKI